MIQSLSDIPADIRHSACSIIRRQISVPESPLSRTSSGDVELCAAAALAVAATPGRERDTLVDKLERRGRDHILDAYEELGWSRELGRQFLVANDSFAAATRKDEVLKLLTVD